MFTSTILPAEQPNQAQDCPMNKRRRFAPNTLPVIASSDNANILHELQDTPLMQQLCEQAPSQQEIEAQLLQVGMRVRKAVSEGYQVTPGRRAFTPRPFFKSNRLSPETLSALSNTSTNEADGNFSAGGLHNVGALSMQPLSTATFCGINLAMMSHLSTSTPIEEQKMWSYSTASKRRQYFDEDSDSDDSQEFMPRTPQLEFADATLAIPQDFFNITSESMIDTGLMAQDTTSRPQAQNRKLAQPKSRLRTTPEINMPIVNPFAQFAPTRPFGHQRMRSCGVEASMDFGEASFLQPRQDFEMDCS